MSYKLEYDKDTSLCNLMDQYAIQRLQRIIDHEKNCTPTDVELVRSCNIVKQHLEEIWGIRSFK